MLNILKREYSILNSIFMDSGKIPVTEYHSKLLVSIITDKASVNTGSISGLMTRLASDRGSLVKIHCINYLVELIIKAAF